VEPKFQVLKWDSEFFGFRVAKLVSSQLNSAELDDIIRQLRSNRIKLAYWASNPEDSESQVVAKSAGLFLADKKVTYSRNILSIDMSNALFDQTIETYKESQLNEELISLALQSGIFSRFNVDTKIPAGKYEQLYKLWIEKSVNKEIAESVLVTKVSDKIVGMVTVGCKNNRGDIGLIAVNESVRGMKIGEKLVNAALHWSVKKGHNTAQVVTQGVNRAACNLYEKCGYHVEKTENIYHIWL
jgi:dTDP-4-amino-4,6-dideoxy-D-galactose acyltransferase